MLWCDGGSRGNPGPAAVGYVLEDERGRLLEEFGEQIGVATATEAECRALIAGLKRVVALGLSRLAVRLDAEVIAAHVRGEQTVDSYRDPALPPPASDDPDESQFPALLR